MDGFYEVRSIDFMIEVILSPPLERRKIWLLGGNCAEERMQTTPGLCGAPHQLRLFVPFWRSILYTARRLCKRIGWRSATRCNTR
jgi:hypothetical protein